MTDSKPKRSARGGAAVVALGGWTGGDGLAALLQGLDGGQIGKDVGVIEFQIVQHQRARPVMDELGALVKKRGVVFVRFHHKEGRASQAGGLAEVGWNAADQKTGFQAGILQNPG